MSWLDMGEGPFAKLVHVGVLAQVDGEGGEDRVDGVDLREVSSTSRILLRNKLGGNGF
jgi:hypothetical protein